MFSFVLVLLALASNVYSQMPINDGLNPDLALKLQKLGIALQEKCLKNVDKKIMGEIILSAQETGACIGQHYSNDMNTKGYCTNDGSTFIKCIQGLADTAKKCLDSNEKYLPDFILNGQKRIFEKFCTSDYQNRINKLAASTCKMPFAQLLNSEFLSTCLPKLKLIKNIDKGIVSLTKPQVCSDLETINTCLINIFKSNCEVDPNDLKVLSSVFEEYQVDCKNVSSAAKVTFSTIALGLLYLIISLIK
ncbi:hypothetical protein RI129_004064 [Pyrocoelia pectoralis]|uniref:Uncharacterized protein n=1 Tax=Pyrocoelia pectoralis TaxID=417401 RepID=A0AAN7ZPM5_9COLE